MFLDWFHKNSVDELAVLLSKLWDSRNGNVDEKFYEIKSYILKKYPTKDDLFNSYNKKNEFGVIGLLFNCIDCHPSKIAIELADILNDILKANTITIDEIRNNNACKIYSFIFNRYADPIPSIYSAAIIDSDMFCCCKKLMSTLIDNTWINIDCAVKSYRDIYDILIYSDMYKRHDTIPSYINWFTNIHSMIQEKIGYCYDITFPSGNIVHSIAKSGNYIALNTLVISNAERKRIINDTNVANSIGKTPLYLAYENKHFAMAKCLEALGYTILEKGR